MIDLLLHPNPHWTEDAKETFFHDICSMMGQIPDPYPLLQVHAVPNGDVRIVIGEGFTDVGVTAEAIIVDGNREYIL